MQFILRRQLQLRAEAVVVRDVVVPPDHPIPAARGQEGQRLQGRHGPHLKVPRPLRDQQQARLHHSPERGTVSREYHFNLSIHTGQTVDNF